MQITKTTQIGHKGKRRRKQRQRRRRKDAAKLKKTLQNYNLILVTAKTTKATAKWPRSDK